MAWGLKDVGEIVAAAGVGVGILKGYQQVRQSDQSMENTKDRQARADERQAQADVLAVQHAETERLQTEMDALISGYRAIFGEVREELNRFRELLKECEQAREEALARLHSFRNRLAEQ